LSWNKPGVPVISLADCIALCGLGEQEVAAIAEHEHIPEIAAATLARYLLKREGGPEDIRRMIADDIRVAFDRGDAVHAAELVSALRHLCGQHPELAARALPNRA
jgi:hypothetical protein